MVLNRLGGADVSLMTGRTRPISPCSRSEITIASRWGQGAARAGRLARRRRLYSSTSPPTNPPLSAMAPGEMLRDGIRSSLRVAGLCIATRHLPQARRQPFAAIGRLDTDGSDRRYLTMSLAASPRSPSGWRLRGAAIHRFATPLDEFMRLLGNPSRSTTRERTLNFAGFSASTPT